MTIIYFFRQLKASGSGYTGAIHAVRNNDSQLAGNPGEKHIGFRSGMAAGLPSSNAHVDLKMVNGSFHNRPDFIEGVPIIGIPLDAGEHAEIHVFVSIGGTSFFSRAAWFSQPQTHCPFTIWTFGHIHLLQSERPFSW